LRALDHVAHQPAHLRGVNPHGVFEAQRRSVGVRCWTNATDSLRDMIGIARVATLEHNFKASKQRPRRPGIFDFSAVDFDLDGEMPFDARDRVNNDASHVRSPPLLSSLFRLFGWRFSFESAAHFGADRVADDSDRGGGAGDHADLVGARLDAFDAGDFDSR